MAINHNQLTLFASKGPSEASYMCLLHSFLYALLYQLHHVFVASFVTFFCLVIQAAPRIVHQQLAQVKLKQLQRQTVPHYSSGEFWLRLLPLPVDFLTA